jgi:hypothetical protein
MVFEGSDRSLSCIGTMFLGRDPLISNIIFGESFFELLRAFIVQNMEGGWMTVLDK